ncbi:chemotaxis protein CheR, partial [candidate division KSB3 bacterium]
MVKVTPAEFQMFSRYIKEISGIHLEQNKTYLLETRLGSLIKEHNCANYKALHDKARQDTSKGLERSIIDAMTTNETLFFRDKGPFELLQHKILPELIDARASGRPGKIPIKIWSAAASTGQELYSICIVIKEL